MEIPLGVLRLVVEHRAPGPAGGPTLRVCEDARELLRFDCFRRGAHWHLDPAGRDQVTRLAPELDPLDWTLGELRRDLRGYVARAGSQAPVEPDAAGPALDAAEVALRNPPLDLDDVDVARLRARRTANWRLFGSEALPAWVAEMDFPPAEPVRWVLERALALDDLGYPLLAGDLGLPELFARRQAERFGWQVEPRQVEALIDVVQGIYVALDAFSERGQGVVVQTPVYPPFLHAIAELDRRRVENPLVQGPDGFAFDLDGLADVLDASSRVLLLCHPHNPTGRVYRRAELERVAELALRHDLIVVSDEIHADLVYPGLAHIPFASLSPEVAARTLTLTSATKAFNLPGLRCAVAVFGSDDLRQRFLRVPRHLRGGVGNLGLDATLAAWRHGQTWLDQVLAYCDGNRRLLTELVASELPGVRYSPPEASFLAWLDCRELGLEPAPQPFFLERGGVALGDGRQFGPPGEGFVRLSFATSRALLRELVARMSKALREGA